MRISDKDWFIPYSVLRRNIRANIEDAGQDVRTAIIRRTTEGRDIHGKPFHPYAESTVRRKGTASVTLVQEGDMLSDLRVARRGNDTEVGFASLRSERKARVHQFGIGLPKREFFGLSRAQRRRLRAKHEPLISAKVLEHDRRTKMRIDLVMPI